ncbi:MAG: hypothetical protein ACM31G_11620 [Flavobacteriales bacterium]
MKKLPLTLFFLFLITLSSCSKEKGEFIYMLNLKNDISKTYNINRVDIKMLNEDAITITLIDSRFNNYSSEKKQKLAKQIGILVTELRGDMIKIKKGELIFTDESNHLIVKTTKSESFNIF